MLILCGCVDLPLLLNPNPPSNNRKNLTPAIIAWGGMYEIAVSSGKDNKTSYYHKAYSEEKNKVVNGIFKKMRNYFISDKFKFSKFSSVQVVSMVDASKKLGLDFYEEEINTKQLYTLILVPTFELSNYHKWGDIHKQILYAGISTLIVKPGEGRIVAASSGIITKTYESKSIQMSEGELIEAFRKLYADAAAIALLNIQKQSLHISEKSSSIITDVYVEDENLRSLFNIKGTHLNGRSCTSQDCQMLGNIAAQLAAHKLLYQGKFVLPPFTGTMSNIGSRWAFKAEEKMARLTPVELDGRTMQIKMNPSDAKQFIAIHINESTKKNVSEYGNQIIAYSLGGHISFCKNTLDINDAKIEQAHIERRRSQEIYCDEKHEYGTAIEFDNHNDSTEYQSLLSPPSKKDSKDNYLGSLMNALND